MAAANGESAVDRVTRVEQQYEAEDTGDVKTWLNSMGEQDIQIKLIRTDPRTWKGDRIDGTLETFNGMDSIDEDIIKDRHGGGGYILAVKRRNSKGVLVMAGQRSIRIAGHPKLGDDFVGPQIHSADSNANIAAIKLMAEENKRISERAERAEHSRPPAIDPALVAMFQSNIETQRQATSDLAQRLAEKDAQIIQLVTKKPDGDAFEHKILDKMLDGESARIEGLRAQHEVEIRTLRENNRADLERERNRHEDAIKTLERRHEREIDLVRDSMKNTAEGVKNSHEMRVDGLKAEIARLERELGAKDKELGELRAKKEKSIPEQAQEFATLKETLGGIFGKDEEEDDRPGWQKAIGMVMENPEAIGQMFAGAKQAVAPQQPQLPPAQPRVLKKRRRPAQPGAATVDAALTTQGDDLPKIDPGELAAAVSFMESACSTNADPVIFAQTARTMVPTNILLYVEKVGIDDFITKVAKVPQSSILRMQQGKNFMRSVWASLLGE
jgi:hypothetical protein